MVPARDFTSSAREIRFPIAPLTKTPATNHRAFCERLYTSVGCTPMSTENNSTCVGILPHHLAELRKSGLSDATIVAAGIESETNYQRLAALLGWRKLPKRMAPALVFPFVSAEGQNGYCRIKPDNPRRIGKRVVKYESPLGRANEIYLPPGVVDCLNRPDAELVLTEGEKKSLKATQEGFACIGLVGVYGWKDGKSERMLPALERIEWRGRQVQIVFDSDVADNPQVGDAEARLAKHLSDRGAIVRVARLPAGQPGPDGKPVKVGLDDYLVAHSAVELRRLLDEAQEPEPISASEMKATASEIDPAEEAKAFLDTSVTDGVPKLRFWRGSFIVWHNRRYRELPHAEARGHLIQSLNTTYCRLSRHVTDNVMDQLRAQAMLPGDLEPPAWIGDPPRDWPADEVLVAKNALVHLPSLLRDEDCAIDPTPRFFSTMALEYDFRSDAPRPDAWLAFLGQLWPDDPQSIGTLQEWVGYCLTGDTRQQKMLLLIGPKRSGKGTIARVLRALIGPANVAGPTLAGIATNFGLWPLIGKSLAIVNDARLSGRSDQAVVVERLLSITGEDALTVDRKFLEPWTGKLPTRLMIISNELPRLSDSSGALVGRMILLRLTDSFFGREDPDLTKKLLAELPGILLWAVEGWRRLRERGRFTQPDSAIELLEDMSDLSSPVGQFIHDCCLTGPEYHVSVADLYRAWQIWCERKGRKQAGTEQTFGRDLLAAVSGIGHYRTRNGDQRSRGYQGIGLLQPHAIPVY
jgi:putative DNA primase/helicase